MKRIPEKYWVISGLIITGIIFIILAFYTRIPEGGADNYAHFNIARWAFRYPHLFLDHWGKPVYTILVAPFAQLGIGAVRIFNSIIGLLTAWYAWKLAQIFQLKYSWFSPVVVVFTAIYFSMMSTGMTEIIFSLVLTVSVFLFFKEKYILSAIYISFIFLARTEGLAFLLPFFIALFYKRQYKAIPFLITGFVIFSFIGWIYYYNDFWWLITERPYAKGGPSVYGSGNWYHFIVNMPNYFGLTIQVLLFTGTFFMIYKWLRKSKIQPEIFLQIILILSTFWGYFFIHSFLWWKGETSAGLQRVMAGVSPMIGIIALFGINQVEKYIHQKYIKAVLMVGISVLLVTNAVKFYQRSVNYDLSAEIKNRVTDWLKESGSLNYKLVMHNPYFAFSTEIDAWNSEVVQYGFSNNDFPEKGLPDSTLFIWDAHFSANEGQLPLSKIMNNQDFELVKYFDPVVPFKVMGDRDYQIFVFRKIANKGVNNIILLDKLKKSEIEKGIYFVEQYDFDNSVPVENIDLSRLKSNNDSTNVSYDMNGLEFSPAFHIEKTRFQEGVTNKIRISAQIFRFDFIQQNRLLLVFSTEIDNQSYHYVTADLNEQITENNIWCKTEFVFFVPKELKKGTMVKVYIWNIDKKHVLLDNLKLEIFKQSEIKFYE